MLITPLLLITLFAFAIASAPTARGVHRGAYTLSSAISSEKTDNLFSTIFRNIPSISLDNVRHGEMTLLAVEGEGENISGTTAKLYVDVTPGVGRVFMYTFPFTKFDTQLSTRFAREIACGIANKDCSKYDFFYTITSGSSIVGGPSAGAAITVLTAAVLMDLPVDESVAITGTINSGGMIGFVGGIREKIEAAAEAGLKTVIIPRGSRFALKRERGASRRDNPPNNPSNNSSNNISSDLSNSTSMTDLVEYGRTLGVDVKPLFNVEDALSISTDNEFMPNKYTPYAPSYYTAIMRAISVRICSDANSSLNNRHKLGGYAGSKYARNNFRNNSHPSYNEYVYNNFTLFNISRGLKLYKRGMDAFSKGRYYSAASFCFGAGIEGKKAFLSGLDDQEMYKTLTGYERSIVGMKKRVLTRKVNSREDFQTNMIVLERLEDAFSNINLSLTLMREFFNESATGDSNGGSLNGKNINRNNVNNQRAYASLNASLNATAPLNTINTNTINGMNPRNTGALNESLMFKRIGSIMNGGYAMERYYSAIMWDKFYNQGGKPFILDKALLRTLCLNKMSEAAERISYAEIIFPFLSFREKRKNLQRVYSDIESSNYEMCWLRSAKVKAETDMLLNAVSLRRSSFNRTIKRRIEMAGYSIGKSERKGIFPILAYSYYEYARSLLDGDPSSAMLYSEYALELSDIDSYMTAKSVKARIVVRREYIYIFSSGLFVGLLAGIILGRKNRRKSGRPRHGSRY